MSDVESGNSGNVMPPEIANAISGVMADVPKLEKGETNKFGKYNFASIDDFLEALRPLCAKAGLSIIQNEESFETRSIPTDRGENAWLVMRFSFMLVHVSGAIWDAGVRTIMVNGSMGSQAFGAAQSYALKQFMRSLFMVATGEKGQDADEHPNEQLPEKRSTVSRETQQWANKLVHDIEFAHSHEALEELMVANADQLKAVPDKTQAHMWGLVDKRKKQLLEPGEEVPA